MNSLIDWSASAAAILIALTSDLGKRICMGVSFTDCGLAFGSGFIRRGGVAAGGIGARTAKASGVSEVGLAMRGLFHAFILC